MKDSKTYSQKLKSLYRSLKRSYGKPQNVTYDEPVDALVYAVVSEKLSEAAANSALKKFRDYFVDWNDLRVSRPEEVIELLGQDNEDTRTTATSLTTILKRSVISSVGKMERKGLIWAELALISDMFSHSIFAELPRRFSKPSLKTESTEGRR